MCMSTTPDDNGYKRTSIFTRFPTVVARPSPPPPDELYKKVGYAPIASSLQCSVLFSVHVIKAT